MESDAIRDRRTLEPVMESFVIRSKRTLISLLLEICSWNYLWLFIITKGV